MTHKDRLPYYDTDYTIDRDGWVYDGELVIGADTNSPFPPDTSWMQNNSPAIFNRRTANGAAFDTHKEKSHD